MKIALAGSGERGPRRGLGYLGGPGFLLIEVFGHLQRHWRTLLHGSLNGLLIAPESLSAGAIAHVAAFEVEEDLHFPGPERVPGDRPAQQLLDQLVESSQYKLVILNDV